MNLATKLLLSGSLFTSLLFAEGQTRIQDYLTFLDTYPNSIGLVGNAEQGEIELLKDSEKMALAAKNTGRELGIVYQDRYWLWVNDPVQFPNGKCGVYGRILSRSSLQGIAGCAVIPRLQDGRIALNCNYRHATRSWELEIPRGITDKGEAPEAAARREVLEETGLVAGNVVFLGQMPTDSGLSNAIAAIFLAEITESVTATPEDSEAIDSIVCLSMQELREGLRKGSLPIQVHGTQKEVFLRDPFLTFALLQMDLRGLLAKKK